MGKEKKSKKEKKPKKRKHESDSEEEDRHSRPRVSVAEQITTADYFRMNAPFTVWLKKKKGVYFDQLEAKASRKLFDKFIDRWNDGELKQKYYDLSRSAAPPDTKDRTGYKWGFASKLDKSERRDLQDLRGNVARTSESKALGTGGPSAWSSAAVQKKVCPVVKGPWMPSPAEMGAYNSQLQQKDRRDYRKDKALELDELIGGKATGHERVQEKRTAAREERTTREQSPDAPGGNPYGDNSFKQAVAKREQRLKDKQTKRHDAAKSKLEAHREKEKAKMAALMEMARVGRTANSLYQPKQ